MLKQVHPPPQYQALTSNRVQWQYAGVARLKTYVDSGRRTQALSPLLPSYPTLSPCVLLPKVRC